MESPIAIRVWSRQATVHIQLAPDYYEWREFAMCEAEIQHIYSISFMFLA